MSSLFDSQNENAFLSILITNPDKIYDANRVKDFMLSSTVSRTLLKEMYELAAQNLLPDPNLLIHTLGTKGKLAEVGGEDFIKYLQQQKYPVENLEQYESLLVDSYKAKKLVELGTELVKLKSANDADVDKIIGSTQEQLENLSISASGENTNTLEDVLKEGWTVLKERINSPGIVGTTTGNTNLDAATGGFANSSLWIVAGRPSMGKSMFMLNNALAAAKSGKPVLFQSFEMNKVALTERLLGIQTGLDISNIHLGLLNQKQVDLIVEELKFLKSLPIYIDTYFEADINYVTSNMKKYRKQKGVELVFLDYVQLMAERDTNATHEIGQISRRLLLTSNDLNICTVVGSQLNRGVEARDDKHPTMADLRQSGNLEEDAFVIAMLYRDEVYNKDSKYKGKLETIITKNKQTGTLGSILNSIDNKTNRIFND